jgi:hypothetical protein
MVKLGRVAIDSTRIQANASRDRVDSEQASRDTRARFRRQVRAWQKAAHRDDAEPGGLEVAIGELNRALAELPPRLERLKKSGLKKSGLKKLSRSDEDARFLRQRGGTFVLGYTGEIAVSDDHLIVAQRVTQNATDNDSLAPLLDQTEERCGAPPGEALADSGFFSIANLEHLEQRSVEGYIPHSNLACELNLGTHCRRRARAAAHRRMRAKLRSPAGQAAYARRKAVVEPVFGVLKQQRAMRQFRTRGMQDANNEFTLATLAYNITRLHGMLAA